MVLCCSRYLFVRPVITMDQRAWTECHVAAFAFFGGVPARLVPDNLKTGVDRPDLYDPRINRSYAELAAHYGCLVDPARSRKPRDKAQVERPMPYIRDSFWRGREFTSWRRCRPRRCAGARRWPGSGPAVRWTAPPRPRCSPRPRKTQLAPLPKAPFVLAEWSRCKVGPDIHVKVGKSLYSVPWRHIGKTLDARSTATMVQLFSGGELVKTHVRKPQGKQTDLADYPPEKIAFHMRTPAWCRRKAAEIGPACTALIGGLLADNALYRLRAAQGVLHLADKHQPGRLEAACAKAAAAGDPSYRTVKGILAAGTESLARRRAGRGRRSGGVPARPRGPVRRRTRRRGNVVPLRAAAPGARRQRHDPPHHAPARRPAPAHRDTGTARHDHHDRDRRPGQGPAHPEAVRDARHHRRPPGPGPRRGTRPHRVPPGPVRRRDLPPRRPCPSTAGCATPGSRNKPPWKASTSPPPRSCPPPRSATWPPCAGCTPASP